MTQPSLDALISDVKDGNHAAFETVYDRYSPALFGVVSKIILDQKQAEDILQEAMVRVWSNIHKFDESKGSFFTWMLNIARNKAIDELRKNRKVSHTSIQNEGASVNMSKVSSEAMRIEHIGVKELLNDIPEDQALMIEYLYFKGYTQQETSDELNLPLGTVKSRSRAALKALRKIMLQLLFWI